MVTRRAPWLAPLLLTATLPLIANSVRGQPGKPSAGGQSRATRQEPDSPWDHAQILARIYLGEFMPAGFPNLVDVKWLPPSSPVRGICEIDFISDWPASPKTLLTYPEGYSFIGASTAGPDLLMTSWSAADSGVFQVFQLMKGGARLVLDKSGWAAIEYWHSTVLVSESAKGPNGEYHYTTTGLWQWNGKQYNLAATVPYSRRLEALARLEHEAKKK